MTHVLAAEGGYQTFHLSGGEWAILLASAATALLAIGVGFALMRGVLAQDEGTPKMKEIALAIQEGAMAYLKRQFKTIILILIPLAVIVFLTSTAVKKDSGVEALSFATSGGAPHRGIHRRCVLVGPDRLHRHESRRARQRANRGGRS